jgi:hypothetical protein
MLVTCINTIDELNQLKSNWEQVYAADSYANFFLSWNWLRSWFEIKPYSWLVLGMQIDRNSPYVAFFPLSIRKIEKYRLKLFEDLNMGGNFAADYTGFICLPEYEEKASQIFANYLKQHLNWDRFRMDDIQDPKLNLFTSYFSDRQFQIQTSLGKASYYSTLPNNWDCYLQNNLGQNTRSSLRRAFKKIENNDRFQITYLDRNNLDSHIQAMCTLNQLRWGQQSEQQFNIYRHIFSNCFQDNSLWSCVLWDGKIPVSAFFGFIDHHKKTFLNYLMSYHPDYKSLGAGKAICAYSIKYAVENHLKTYDFGRGDFDFKHLLGGQKRFNNNTLILRKNLRTKAFNFVKENQKLWQQMT